MENWLASTGADFAHQGEEIVVGIAEEGHPQIVVRHFGDEMRCSVTSDALRYQTLVGTLDVIHLEVNHGTSPFARAVLGNVQHQTYASAIEEGQVWHLEQELHAERVAIERHGALQIRHRNGDLSDYV